MASTGDIADAIFIGFRIETNIVSRTAAMTARTTAGYQNVSTSLSPVNIINVNMAAVMR